MSTTHTLAVLVFVWTILYLNVPVQAGTPLVPIRKTFKEYCVDAHNLFRARHKVPNVKWSNNLEREAKSWAKYLGATNNFFRGSKGENLYITSDFKTIPKDSCQIAVEEFNSEGSQYDFSKAILLRNSERFTQLVWKNTLEIGAAVEQRKDGKIVVVVRYNPPGNYNSTTAFKLNVLPEVQQTSTGQSGATHVKLQIPLTVIVISAVLSSF